MAAEVVVVAEVVVMVGVDCVDDGCGGCGWSGGGGGGMVAVMVLVLVSVEGGMYTLVSILHGTKTSCPSNCLFPFCSFAQTNINILPPDLRVRESSLIAEIRRFGVEK